MGKLNNTDEMLEWLYTDVYVGNTNHEEPSSYVDKIVLFSDTDKPLHMSIPPFWSNSDYNGNDRLHHVRLSFTEGEHMDLIHNIYNQHAIFVGHVFGSYTEKVNDQGVKERHFQLCKRRDEATHSYREIIWQCRSDKSSHQPSLQHRASCLREYSYSVEMKFSDGTIGGIDVDVAPIVRGIEGIAEDYFEKLALASWAWID